MNILFLFLLPASTIYDCDFTNDLCMWGQSPDDNFDWTRAQGPTGTLMTGPTNDHTSGTSGFSFSCLR
ncbi:hypothetical protein DPMN_011714 [Dreissena polymorpha]|uniref:MAM domain-containing protein n=1 Tax=Dreissena polymorpha TaxID=45954 RepID=A0A9D4N4J0_DREPO|nr:hypothetical protein DPMN_011714 [Dreissena polymorpha]